MAFTKRRIVTGHDDSGAPVIVSDGPAEPSFLGRTTASMWYVGERPATVDDGGEEPSDRKDFVPPPGGISWRFFTLKPSGGKAIGPTDDPRFDQDRVGFHATPTIDFIEVISGQHPVGTERSLGGARRRCLRHPAGHLAPVDCAGR